MEQIRKAATIKKYISKHEKTIAKLKDRKDSITEKLDGIDVLSLDESEAGEKVGNLSSQKTLVTDRIEKLKTEVETLDTELQQAQQVESREANFDQAVQLAKDADKAMKEYTQAVKKWNKKAADLLEQANKAKQQWRQATNSFMNTVAQIEPAFRLSSDFENLHPNEITQKCDVVIEKVETESGVSTRAARTTRNLQSRTWRKPFHNSLSLPKAKYNFRDASQTVAREVSHRQRVEREQAEKEAAE